MKASLSSVPATCRTMLQASPYSPECSSNSSDYNNCAFTASGTARPKVSDWPSAPSNKYEQRQQQQQSVEADSHCTSSGNKQNCPSVSYFVQRVELHLIAFYFYVGHGHVYLTTFYSELFLQLIQNEEALNGMCVCEITCFKLKLSLMVEEELASETLLFISIIMQFIA